MANWGLCSAGAGRKKFFHDSTMGNTSDGPFNWFPFLPGWQQMSKIPVTSSFLEIGGKPREGEIVCTGVCKCECVSESNVLGVLWVLWFQCVH